MSIPRAATLVPLFVFLVMIPACDLFIPTGVPGQDPAEALPPPDGIDPLKPNIERSTQSVDFQGIRTVRIEVPTGRVTVTQQDGAGGATVKATETIIPTGLPIEALRRLLTESTLAAKPSFVDPGRLDVIAAVADELADEDVAFDIRVVIPGAANVEIIMGNGPVEVSGVTGNVEIRTDNGLVVVDHVSGSVVAHTGNRPIDLVDVTGNVQVQTHDAEITMRLAPPADGTVSAVTTHSSIRLTVPKTVAAELNLEARDGIISANLSGFDVSDIVTASGYLSGTLNAGTGRIEARTTNGDIQFLGM